MKLRPIAEATFKLFSIPMDDQDTKYLSGKHEHVRKFYEDNDEFITEAVFHWIELCMEVRKIPLAILPTRLLVDILELGMVYGYLLKESELRRL